MIWQQIANGIATGAVYALTTLGLTMVYGVLRVLHVAHAGIYALGAYVGVVAFRLLGDFWLSLLASWWSGSFTPRSSTSRASCP